MKDIKDIWDCIRCGTDCTGDDDYPGFHVGDVAICFEPDEGYLEYIHLCEACKQGLDTVVERYLKREDESNRYVGHPVGGRPVEAPELPGCADMDKKIAELNKE